MAGRDLSGIDKDKVVAEYLKLKSVVKTAKKFGIGRATVKRWLIEKNIARFGPRKIDPNREQKFCSRCGHEKDIEEFWIARGRTDGRQGWCKDCSVTALRESSLKAKYGITRDQYDAMLQEQDNSCAICGSSPDSQPTYGKTGKRFELHVDHCHDTGRVRGLLCNSCNSGLGRFKDDPVRLFNAIEYLNKEY